MAPADVWAVKLGERHGARERALCESSHISRRAAEDHANAAAIRWPRIVEAMTRLVAAYNKGAGRAVIDIAEDRSASSGPTVMLRADRDETDALSVTLEASAIYARRPGSHHPSWESEYRLSGRSDDATAAYVLQPWMAQLQATVYPGGARPASDGQL